MNKAKKVLAAVCAAVVTWNGGFAMPPGDLRAVWDEVAHAVDIVANGNCGAEGNNLTWTLDSEGLLTISGEGEMQQIHSSDGSPWYAHHDSIKKAVIGEGVTGIASYAFRECRDLQEVSIPATVASLGDSIFEYCGNLTAIAVDAENPAFCVKDGILFTGDMAELYCCPPKNPQITTVYEIPDNVRKIAGCAFCDCDFLEEIIIPESVEEIGNCAFWGCSALKKAELPSSVKSIPIWCFAYCTALPAEIPNHITSISPWAFYNCNFTEITMPESLTYLDGSAFERCPLVRAVFPNAVCAIEDIGDDFPKSAVIFGRDGSPMQEYARKTGRAFGIIGEYSVVASGECGAAETDDVQWSLDSKGVLTVSGRGACGEPKNFYNRDFVQKIVIKEGVDGISGGAFSYFNNLEEVSLPKSVTEIGNGVFYYDHALKNITAAKGNPVYRTEGGILLDKTSVICCPPQNETAAYSIPDGIETIGNSAFSGCTGLKEITMPETIKALEPYALAGCTGLENVTLPESVETISEYAFMDCTGMQSVTVLNPACEIYAGEPVDCAPNGEGTFPEHSELRGYENSTLQAYAEKYSRKFFRLTNRIAFSGNCGAEGDNVKYVLSEDGTLTISGTGAMADYGYAENNPFFELRPQIKRLIVGNGVTGIGSCAFEECTNLVSVQLPEDMGTKISVGAFSGCTSLQKIVLPVGVQFIENCAFSGCSALEKITLPETVTYIGAQAFKGCISLARISVLNKSCDIDANSDTFPESTVISGYQDSTAQGYAKEHGRTFVEITASGECGTETSNVQWILTDDGILNIFGTGDMNSYDTSNQTAPTFAPWYDYREQIQAVVVEDGVTSIGSDAFERLTELKTANLPETLSSVGYEAFHLCSKLEGITIPDSVVKIEIAAFAECAALQSVHIGKNVRDINDGWGIEAAFWYCPALEEITVSEENETYFAEDGVLFRKDGMELHFFPPAKSGDYVLPASTKKLKSGTFFQCPNLKSITFPDGFSADLAERVIYSCTALERIEIGSDVSRIEEAFLTGCPNLLEISVHDENPNYSSKNGILFGSYQKDLLRYPAGKNWSHYDIPEGVQNIRAVALEGCLMKTVGLPESLKNIGERAFSGAKNMTAITIPEGATSIGDYAFRGCTSLQNITIMNPACEIYDSADTIFATATIQGFSGSTAQAYAETYNRTFVSLDEPQETTTTGITTTTTSTTTTTAEALYKDELFLELGVLGNTVYKTENPIESVEISDKSICICVFEGIYLNVQALRPGSADIIVTVSNGDQYIIHLTVTGEPAETTTEPIITAASTTTTTTKTTTTSTTSKTTTTTTTTATTTTTTTAPVTTTTATETEPVSTSATLDRFSFTNQAKLFWDYPNDQYFLSAEDYRELASRLTPCENNDVLFYLAPKNRNGGPNPQGVCYGFDILAMMRMCGLVTPADLGQGAENLRDLKLDDYLKSKIVYHYLLQITARDLINSFYDPYYTEPEKRIIGIIQDSLAAGKPVLIGYGNDQMCYHHSILAYAITEYTPGSVDESVLLQRNGEVFPAKWRVHIYDPNMKPEEDPARYDLYFSDSDTWWIPKNSYGSSVPRSHLEFAIDDVNLLSKASLFYNGEATGENVKKHAYLDIRAGREAVPSRFDQGGVIYSAGDEDSGIRQVGGAWSVDDETGDDALAYCLEFEKSDYLVDFGEGVYSAGDIRIRYPDSIFRVEMEAGLNSALFSPNAVEITARLNKDYTLSAVRNEAGKTGFHGLTVKGASSATITLAECKRGWILTAGNALKRLELTADDTAMIAATGANSVLIGENNGNIGIWLDLDGDDSYETEFSGLHPADTTNDGSLNLADAVASAKALAEAPGSIYPAKDVNGDGVLSLADLAKILRILQNR